MLVVAISNTGGGLQGLSGCRVDSHSELSRVSSGETLWQDVGFVAIGTKSFSTARWTGFKTAKSNKPELAASTALAAKFMGFPLCFLDAGSGALQPVPAHLIRAVRTAHDGPLIVGGGIRRKEDMEQAWNAGANLVVVGTLFEEQNPAADPWPLT